MVFISITVISVVGLIMYMKLHLFHREEIRMCNYHHNPDIIIFEDANFERALIENNYFDRVPPFCISCFEGRQTLDLRDYQIQSIPELVYFTGLEFLYVSDNFLKEINVSQCPKLRRLFVDGNYLSSLDVSHNTALEILDCENNKLRHLDLSQNVNLSIVDCRSNYLEQIVFPEFMPISSLMCSNNYLKELKIPTGSEFFGSLFCENNYLGEFNLEDYPTLSVVNLNGEKEFLSPQKR